MARKRNLGKYLELNGEELSSEMNSFKTTDMDLYDRLNLVQEERQKIREIQGGNQQQVQEITLDRKKISSEIQEIKEIIASSKKGLRRTTRCCNF